MVTRTHRRLVLVAFAVIVGSQCNAQTIWDATADFVPNVVPAQGIGAEQAWSYGVNWPENLNNPLAPLTNFLPSCRGSGSSKITDSDFQP